MQHTCDGLVHCLSTSVDADRRNKQLLNEQIKQLPFANFIIVQFAIEPKNAAWIRRNAAVEADAGVRRS